MTPALASTQITATPAVRVQLLRLLSSLLIFTSVAALVSAEDHGFLRCALTKPTMSEQQNVTEDCKLSSVDHGAEKVSFCYVLFRNDTNSSKLEVTMSGCWMGGENECLEDAHRSEHSGACYHRKNGATQLLFCCCLDQMCNKNFTPLTPIEKPSPDVRNEIRKLSEELAYSNRLNWSLWSMFRYIALSLLALPVIGFLLIRGLRKHRKNNAPQNHYGYDNQFEKSPSEMAVSMLPLKSVSLGDLAAQGRFGAVYRGIYHDMPVAVKIFPAGERQSWEKELEVYRLPQMLHQNILRFIGTGLQHNEQTGLTEYWLLTSWHELGSLYDFLCRNTISYNQLLQLSDSIAKGVMHIHTEAPASKHEGYKPSMAHRDIKSRNIILKDDCTACIADFGLAIIFEPGVNIGETHGQVGTRRYMAPEVLEGAISFDQEAFQRIDMYAVSLVLWEMLSRTNECDPAPKCKLPFEDQVGQHPSLDDMQETVVNRKVRPPIHDSWRENPRLSVFVFTLEECWDADADARLSACTVHERLQFLLANQWAAEIVDDESVALLPASERPDALEMHQMV